MVNSTCRWIMHSWFGAACFSALIASRGWAGATIDFQINRPGPVSVAVYDAHGHMVRTLMSGQTLEPGKHSATWDGLDAQGKPAAAGSYQWRLMRHDGLTATYLLSLGTSCSYHHWPSQHGGPRAVEAIGGRLYMTASLCEGSPQAVCVDLDADLNDPNSSGYHWAMPTLEGWHQGADLTVLGDRMYFISMRHYNDKPDERFLYVRDIATGEGVSRGMQVTLPLTEADASTPTPVTIERIDAAAGQLVAASSKGVIGWLDPQTLNVLKHRKMPADLKDIAVTPAGQVVALYADRLLLIADDVAEPKTLIDKLTDARCVDVDLGSGEILISIADEDQRIHRFDANGKLIKSYGQIGGRRLGKYVAENFREVLDVAADGMGGFVITETEAPRRTAHFDREGHLLREWYGGQQFYTDAVPDPEDATQVWMDTQWNSIMHISVDYAARRWKVIGVYKWAGDINGDNKVDVQDDFFINTYKMAQGHRVLRFDLNGDGKKEVYLSGPGNGGYLAEPDDATGMLKPVALYAGILPRKSWDWWKVEAKDYSPLFLEAMAAKGIKEDDKTWGERRKWHQFTWADANGDHVMQLDELTIQTDLPRTGTPDVGRNLYIDDQLNLYIAMNPAGWRMVPCTGRTPTGAPVWSPDKVINHEQNMPAGEVQGIRPDGNGGWFVVAHHTPAGDGYKSDEFAPRGHGFRWPGPLISANSVYHVNASGEVTWVSGLHAAVFNDYRGRLHYPVDVCGPIDGIIGVPDKIVHPCELWTTDGLYVGGVMDHGADDGLPRSVYTWWRGDISKGDYADGWRNFALHQYDMQLGGTLVKTADGQMLWFGSGWNNIPVYRIDGLDKIERQSGSVELKSATTPAVGQGTGLNATYFVGEDFTGEPIRTTIDPQVWFGVYGYAKHLGVWWPRVGENADAAMPLTDQTRKRTPIGAELPAKFCVRWEGFIEPRYSEAYVLGVYYHGAKIWLDDKLVMDTAGKKDKQWTEPIALTAGHRYAIRIDWQATEGANSDAHLVWYSFSQAIEHVPTTALYPARPVTEVKP
ncbi:MAG: hypothetical protein GC162_13340 [Planctomycetes bacterium]|nr:hypothetical protein [Planctomycetota bacterium]